MPNGNDKWSQYEEKPGGKWAQFEEKPTPKVTQIERDASADSSTAAKLGRGFTLGAAEGAGIVPTTDTSLTGGVEAQSVKQFGKGLVNLGSAALEDVGSIVVDPFVSPEKRKQSWSGSKTFDLLASGFQQAGVESLKGIKDRDPEQFAHGLGSLITQTLMLRGAKKLPEGVSEAGAVGERARLAKTSAALDIGKGEIADLKTAMPEIVKQAQAAGVDTVGDFGKNLKTARKAIDTEFNNGMASFGHKPYVPMEISRRLRNLITSDMAQTTEGQAQAQYIKDRAVEYEKPWTYDELNAKRRTENDKLTSFYGKDTRGQAASPLDTEIAKAIRDEAANIVYKEWDKRNPGGRAKLLKQRQGALWAIDDYVNSKDGFLADLEAKQLQHEGKGPLDRLKAHAYVSGGGPRAHITGLTEIFSRGPEASANAKIRKAFPSGNKTPFKQAAVASLPIGALVGSATPFQGPPPLPEPPEQ